MAQKSYTQPKLNHYGTVADATQWGRRRRWGGDWKYKRS
jgi:hypothetical protein